MSEDLSKLSSADIRRFEKAVTEAKALTVRQEEIAKKVIDTEIELGKVRMASLKEYFDEYSKGLDAIIARKTSQLNDAFLIMERKATESFTKAADDAEKVTSSKRKSKAQKAASNDTSVESVSEPETSKQKQSNGRQAVKTTTKRTTKRTNKSDSGNNNTPPGKPTGGGTIPPDDDGVDVYQTQDDEKTAKLGRETTSAEHIAEKLKAFNTKYKTAEEQLNAVTEGKEDAIMSLASLKELQKEQDDERLENYAKREKELAGTLTELMLARQQAEENSDKQKEFRLNRLKDLQIANVHEVTEAELSAQKLVNKIEAERALIEGKNTGGEDYSKELGELSKRKTIAENTQKSIQQIEEARLVYIARKELEAKRKNGGILEAEDATRIQKQAAEKFKVDKESLDKITKKRIEQEAKAAEKERGGLIRKDVDTLTNGSWEERKEALHNLTHDEAGDKDNSKILAATVAAIDKGFKAIGNFARKLESQMDDIGSYKSAIDTRLYGSSNKTASGSYWDQITKDIASIGAVNPFFKQADFSANIKNLVDQGIAFDLEQRAFLMTIQSKIANTFEVADGTLLRLIRIQQEDTTAGRLGMEAALNAFLNNMYENTEYLKQVADSVRGSLAEMQSLMDGAEAAEVEYQVQKWLGSLYSVGMSDAAVNSISTTLGQIAAGQIEGLTNGGTGNLLVMAANNAGLSIADILTEGIDSKDTNDLLQAVVNYLAEIAESSKDNKVVQQQLADVFGVKASDLRAATNLTNKNSVGAIYNNSMSYNNMLSQLTMMAGSMGDRTSLSEQMTNIWENVQYSIAGSMTSNPATYFLYKVASMLDDTVGGIAIPAVSVLGNMVDLETTVADLMRVGAMAGGIIGSFGDLMSGLENSFSGQAMLSKLGISAGAGIAVTPRGDGGGIGAVGGGSSSTSSSGYVGNASSSDVKEATMQEANDNKKQLMIEAQEEAEANEINMLNATVLKIYELLDDVAHGNSCFRVKVENYGLTKSGVNSAQGGVGGIFGGDDNSIGGFNNSGISGSTGYSGWTITY